jgi:hypothetical protein
MSKPLYIFDLNGTLALIDHRRHFVECERDKQDWKAFYAACVHDKPNLPVLRALTSLEESGAEIWVWSGRSDEVAEQTKRWFDHVFVAPYQLQMRPAGDFTPDDQLKRQWLLAMSQEDRQRLVAVFDDRDKVVKMWRDNGVTCFQVAPGSF